MLPFWLLVERDLERRGVCEGVGVRGGWWRRIGLDDEVEEEEEREVGGVRIDFLLLRQR